MLLRATLVALAIAGATAQQVQVPSIEATGSDIIVTAPFGDVIVTAPSGDVQFNLGVGPASERTVTMSDLLARIVSLEATVTSQAATIVGLQAGSSTVNLTPSGSADGATPATITAVRDAGSGVGLTISSVHPAADDQGGESSHAEMVIDSTGNVGLGVADPTDRLSVSGNIRATGEITVNNVNLLEQLRETQASLASLRNTVLGNADHVYQSCNHAHANLTASGETPMSGVYTVQPRGRLSSDTWQVYCDMRSDGGWLRIGRNSSVIFDNEPAAVYDADFVSQDDMDVVAGHVAGLGAFDDFEVDCNLDFAMQADDTANDHRVFYVSIDNLKAGHLASSQIGEMRMGRGWDNTFLLNRAADSCSCCDEVSSSNPNPRVFGTCMNPFTDVGSDLSPGSPHYGGPRVPAAFPGSCTAIMCNSKSRYWGADRRYSNSCGSEGKPERGQTIENIVFTRLEFRPGTDCGNPPYASCARNRFNLAGNHYFIYLK